MQNTDDFNQLTFLKCLYQLSILPPLAASRGKIYFSPKRCVSLNSLQCALRPHKFKDYASLKDMDVSCVVDENST